MSGPIKHNTTGLWVEEGKGNKKKNPPANPAQRAEKKSELIMNIHVAAGLNDCCFARPRAGGKNSLQEKRGG